MKKAFLLVAVLTALAGCKKHASSPKHLLLTKVIVNGQIENEYVYDSKGQLIEEKTYNGGVVYYRFQYVYDAAGKLTERFKFKLPNTKPYEKIVYKLNATGRINSMSFYSLTGADSGKLKSHKYHEYDADNRLTQELWTDENTKPTAARQYTYYSNGNVKASENYEINNQVTSKNDSTHYGPSDTTLPASFYQVTANPLNYYYNELVSPYMNLYIYDLGQIKQEFKSTISDRKYNADGLVVQQTITTKKIKPVSPFPNEVRKMQYEYKDH